MRENALTRRKAALVEGAASIVVNTVLFAAKYYVGALFNSVAVLADAFHTLSDSLTSVVLVLSYGVASKPPDREHPFGHGRAEVLGGLLIGILLAFVAYEFMASSYSKLVSKSPLQYSDLLVSVLLASSAAKALLSTWAYRLGSKCGSDPIKADAWHHVSDVAATGVLAVAIYAGKGYWWVDGALGLAVSALVLVVALRVIYRASSELLGRAPSKAELEELKRVVREAHPMVSRVHHVHFHKYGDHVEVTLHIELPGDMPLSEAHGVATEVEKVVRKKLGYEVTVHVEPRKSEKEPPDQR